MTSSRHGLTATGHPATATATHRYAPQTRTTDTGQSPPHGTNMALDASRLHATHTRHTRHTPLRWGGGQGQGRQGQDGLVGWAGTGSGRCEV